MTAPATYDLEALATAFRIEGDFRSAAPYGSGHINDTFAVVFDQAGTPVRYILQRINHLVFTDPAGLMDNVERVTRHTRAKLLEEGCTEVSRCALSLVPARTGEACHVDADGNTWRIYLFVEQARTYDQIENEQQAFEAARAFGRFQQLLADLPGDRLVETVPDFHHTRSRFDAFTRVLEADAHGRAATARAEIDFVRSRESLVDVLLDLQARGELPERATHNDCKLNNVMIDDASSEGICVIDLDTTMPGLALYDFGDMVRTATSPALEDEQDLSKVAMQMPMFEALTRGYLESAGAFLLPAEIDQLAFSGKLITLEIGIRFLTDYLEGDVYFKTHRDGHNLDRCRTQFRLVECIEEQEEAMRAFVAATAAAG